MLHLYFTLEAIPEEPSALYCKYTKMEMFLCDGLARHLVQLLH